MVVARPHIPLFLQPDLPQPLLQIIVGGDRLRIAIRVLCAHAAGERFDQIVGTEVEEERHRIARMAGAAGIGVAHAVRG